jgi:hypothetical protein
MRVGVGSARRYSILRVGRDLGGEKRALTAGSTRPSRNGFQGLIDLKQTGCRCKPGTPVFVSASDACGRWD